MEQNQDSGRRERWRLALTLGPVIILACCLLVVDTLRALLGDIHRALFAFTSTLIEWTFVTKPDAQPTGDLG